jgi:dihydropteroate synthase
MGILNVTPDSFSDGGQYDRLESAVRRAEEMACEGADVIDIGGESTRPGSVAVPAEEELRRVLPVVREVAGRMGLAVSVDTQKAEVARAALGAGAAMVNDVSALRTDEAMAGVLADADCAVCLMHMLGTPRDMQNDPCYEGDVVEEIRAWLGSRADAAVSAGIARERLLVDPGLGFGKRPEHNLELLKRLDEFHALGLPVVCGHSRKSTIGLVTGEPVEGRLWGSLGAAAAGVLAGAQVLRVHDVKPTVDVVRVCEAIRQGICYTKS